MKRERARETGAIEALADQHRKQSRCTTQVPQGEVTPWGTLHLSGQELENFATEIQFP